METTDGAKKRVSKRGAPNALRGLAVIFLAVFIIRPLGTIAELHPLEAYTDTGVHAFVPYDIEAETRSERFRYIGYRTYTKYKVVYRSAGDGDYVWTDDHELSSRDDAEGEIRAGERVEKKVYTVADGSYVVDDADHTPADYIKRTIVTNGAISLAALALLLVVLRPWIKRNFLALDAPAWTAERVKQGVATPLMMAGIVVAAFGILDLTYAFDAMIGPFLPASLRSMLFDSPATRLLVIAMGIGLFVIGARWSNRYGAAEDTDGV